MAMSNSERVKRDIKKKQGAGMRQVKVWIHPDEADTLRQYAKTRPLTKQCWSKLSDQEN